MTPAAIVQAEPRRWALSGHWTAQGLNRLPRNLQHRRCEPGVIVLEGGALEAVDSTGAWVLHHWLAQHRAQAELRDWPAQGQSLMALVAQTPDGPLPQAERPSVLARTGRQTVEAFEQARALLAFVGQSAISASHVLSHPRRMRWRATLRNIEIGGVDALPIIGLTAFLIGVVVAYQGADQLKHYGANIFVVELVGFSVLREFGPLIGAIIIAGRSGSAYAAQIGTMVVNDEIDAMRTLDIEPIEMLVLPKVLALAVALPLLTVFADVMGVIGGMVMARTQLDIGFREFLGRFGQVMQGSALLLGLGKSVVFAVIIAMIGCFQGFRARGGADGVGRQTTVSVVQAIFLVLVADALFSVAFNMLDL